MNQAVKDALKKRADGLRAESRSYGGYAEDALARSKDEQEDASHWLSKAKEAAVEAAEFDRLIAIYEAAK